MQVAQLVECHNCRGLRDLLAQIECSILEMIKTRRQSDLYGLRIPWDADHYDSLLHYKRILMARIYNNTYPSTSIDVQDIYTQVAHIIVKKNCCNCHKIPN